MTALSAAILTGSEYGAVNGAITTDLDTYDVSMMWPFGASLMSGTLGGLLVAGSQVQPAIALNGSIQPTYFQDYYNRIHIVPKEVNFGNISERKSTTLSIFNAYFGTSTPSSVVIADSFLQLSTFGALAPLEEITVTLTALVGAVNNLDLIIYINWIERVQSFFSVIGQRVLTFPYQPSGWREEITWLTNVIKSYDGSEKRVKLLKNPKMMLSAEYPIPTIENQRANNLIYGWAKLVWLVPIWSQPIILDSLVVNGLVLSIPTTGTICNNLTELIIWESPTKFETVQVESDSGTDVTILTALENTYTSKVYVMATAKGIAKSGIERATDGYRNTVKIVYTMKDLPIIGGTVPDQYLGNDIYTDIQLTPNSGLVPEEMLTRFDEVTNGIANSTFYTPWLNIQPSRIYTVQNDTIEETLNFKKWLERRGGKFRAFWTPSFENDFTVVQTTTITTSVLCRSNSFETYGTARDHIAIWLTTGSWIFTNIISQSDNGNGTMSINLSSSLGIQPSTIKMICHLGLKRLDTDRVEMYYTNGGRSSTSLRIVEIEP